MRFRDLVLDVDDPYVRVVGKGRVTRDCPIPPKLVAAVQVYITSRAERVRRRPRLGDPVWLNNSGGPLTSQTLNR